MDVTSLDKSCGGVKVDSYDLAKAAAQLQAEAAQHALSLTAFAAQL